MWLRSPNADAKNTIGKEIAAALFGAKPHAIRKGTRNNPPPIPSSPLIIPVAAQTSTFLIWFS